MTYQQHPLTTLAISHGEPLYRNYVAFFGGTGRAKVGITSNLKKRRHYYKQESTRHDLGEVTVEGVGMPLSKRAALLIEREICRQLREYAAPRHREWFVAGVDDFVGLVMLTRRFQEQLAETLAAQKASHA